MKLQKKILFALLCCIVSQEAWASRGWRPDLDPIGEEPENPVGDRDLPRNPVDRTSIVQPVRNQPTRQLPWWKRMLNMVMGKKTTKTSPVGNRQNNSSGTKLTAAEQARLDADLRARERDQNPPRIILPTDGASNAPRDLPKQEAENVLIAMQARIEQIATDNGYIRTDNTNAFYVPKNELTKNTPDNIKTAYNKLKLDIRKTFRQKNITGADIRLLEQEIETFETLIKTDQTKMQSAFDKLYPKVKKQFNTVKMAYSKLTPEQKDTPAGKAIAIEIGDAEGILDQLEKSPMSLQNKLTVLKSYENTSFFSSKVSSLQLIMADIRDLSLVTKGDLSAQAKQQAALLAKQAKAEQLRFTKNVLPTIKGNKIYTGLDGEEQKTIDDAPSEAAAVKLLVNYLGKTNDALLKAVSEKMTLEEQRNGANRPMVAAIAKLQGAESFSQLVKLQANVEGFAKILLGKEKAESITYNPKPEELGEAPF